MREHFVSRVKTYRFTCVSDIFARAHLAMMPWPLSLARHASNSSTSSRLSHSLSPSRPCCSLPIRWTTNSGCISFILFTSTLQRATCFPSFKKQVRAPSHSQQGNEHRQVSARHFGELCQQATPRYIKTLTRSIFVIRAAGRGETKHHPETHTLRYLFGQHRPVESDAETRSCCKLLCQLAR